MDGAFKTYTSLQHSLTQADLDFLIFVQRNKIDSALCKLPLKKYGSYNAAGKALGLTHKTVAAKARKYHIEE